MFTCLSMPPALMASPLVAAMIMNCEPLAILTAPAAKSMRPWVLACQIHIETWAQITDKLNGPINNMETWKERNFNGGGGSTPPPGTRTDSIAPTSVQKLCKSTAGELSTYAQKQ